MNKFSYNKPFQSVILIFIVFFSCSIPPVVKNNVTTPIEKTKKKESYIKEIQGYCFIATKQGKVKTILAASLESDTIKALLMDEFGITLTIVSGSDSTDTLISCFPPLTNDICDLFSTAVLSFFRAVQIDPAGNTIIKEISRKETSSYYYFSNNTLDSTIIQKDREQNFIFYRENSFSLLNEDRDTVCNCFWEK